MTYNLLPPDPESIEPVDCGWRCYLSLGSIEHQVVELAEDALLQLIPGDAPVLTHQEGRPKPDKTGGWRVGIERRKGMGEEG